MSIGIRGKSAASYDDVAAACASLSAAEVPLYALLVMSEPTSLTAWGETVHYAGFRPTPNTRYNAQNLRPLYERLEALGLAASPDRRLICPRAVRPLAWRWCAKHPSYPMASRAAFGGYTQATSARASLYGADANTFEELARLAALSPDAVIELALEATGPDDDRWLDSLQASVRLLLLEHALVAVERAALPVTGAFAYVGRRLRDAPLWPQTTLAAWAGVALARGDFERCREIVAIDSGSPLALQLRVALAFVEGRGAEARAVIPSLVPPKKGAHLGIVAALVVLAMRAEGVVTGAGPWLRLGAAKTAPYGSSFALLTEMMEDRSPRAGHAGDVLRALLQHMMMESVHASAPLLGLGQSLARLHGYAQVAAERGYRWLSEQYAFAVSDSAEWLSSGERARLGFEPKPPPSPLGPSILKSRSSRPSWELDLDRVEAALPLPSKPNEADAPVVDGAERVVWRVFGMSCSIEPYLQKRGPNGKWSGGRKLAIKHLAHGAPGLRLPPEDLAMGRFVREVREGGYYPQTFHTIEPSAWLALVGHPRVFDEAGEVRLDVVRGEVKVVSRAVEGGVRLAVEPPFTSAGVHPQRVAGEVVVYEVTAAMKPVLAALQRPVVVPAEGKDRLAGTLRRLASVMAVETSEDVAAQTLAADSTIHARLIPTEGGLAVSLLVRPLGPGTTALTPGTGLEKVTGRADGRVVQATRDLAREIARADAVVAACGNLEAHATGIYAYRVLDPEDALAVVAALRDLGETIVTEWPQGAPIRIRARVGRRGLRGQLTTQERGFWFRGSVHVDDALDVDLERMLELLAANPGRYVAVAPGEYLELEQELRDLLAAIAAARIADARGSGKGTQQPGALLHRAAIGVLEALTDENGAVDADDDARSWRSRLDDAFRRAPAVPKSFQGELRDYQIEGFRWMSRLAAAGLGACLADDMGLGKTVQIAALLLHRGASGPALVVAPTSVCEGWCRELARFAPTLRIRRAFGSSRAAAMSEWKRRDVVITSYTLLHQEADAFQAMEWATVVLDEAQLVKNAETLRAKAAMGLSAGARIVATGTPVENHAGDLFSLFSFLNPGLLGTQKAFLDRIGKGGVLPRPLKRQLQPFILRRTKSEVLDDLPPITEIQRDVMLSPGEAKLYDSIRRAALAKLAEGGARDRIRMFAELTRLRRLCCHPGLVAPEAGLGSAKLESFMELVEELRGAGHRALVFSQFTDVLALACSLLDAKAVRYQYLDGSTPTAKRAAAVDAFQAGDGDLFLVSLKAGGFGLNLTGADYVIHLDPWWNPAVESQATDRAHRIGQTRPVTVYRLVTVATIEERVVALHREKRDLAAAVLEDTDQSAKLTANEMRALLDAE